MAWYGFSVVVGEENFLEVVVEDGGFFVKLYSGDEGMKSGGGENRFSFFFWVFKVFV